jgi:hypothetical protein
MNAIKSVLLTIGTNLVSMFMTKTVILWALKLATKQTENKVDDNVVLLVEAAYNNDSAAFQAATEELVKSVKSD